MATDPDEDVIPSAVDPDIECVRIGSRAHGGGDARPSPTPPPGGGPVSGPGPCPPGYVPRRRRRPYDSAGGKRVVTGEPPTRNPRSEDG